MSRAPSLVWRGAVTSIAARAEAWAYLAEAGMLSVVWPKAADPDAVDGGATFAIEMAPTTRGALGL